jgi:hypothetical protein
MGCFYNFQKKLPKVSNHPIVENSPYLVTMVGSKTSEAIFEMPSVAWLP